MNNNALEFINYKGKAYIIRSGKDEPDQHFRDRVWFVVQAIERNLCGSINDAVAMSHLWSSHTHMGCVYSENIMTKLQEMQPKRTTW